MVSAGVPFPGRRPLGAWSDDLGGELAPELRAFRPRAIAPVDRAGPDDLAPLVSARYLEAARATTAVLLVSTELADRVPGARRWVLPSATYALARLLQAARAEVCAPPPHVDPSAQIAPSAVVLPGAVVGAGCRVEPHAVVYGGARLGARVHVGAGAVVGREGFGFATSPEGASVRIPQLGGVILEDDVEVGPLCTIDAGTLSPTRVGRGTKLDAHVHVGHNVELGRGCFVAAQVGFAGSVRLGDGVLVGGQAGIADHVTVGSGARIAAKAGVIGDVPPNGTVAGYPAVPRARWLRAAALAMKANAPRRR